MWKMMCLLLAMFVIGSCTPTRSVVRHKPVSFQQRVPAEQQRGQQWSCPRCPRRTLPPGVVRPGQPVPLRERPPQDPKKK